jgi:hypothetical protein
VEGVMRHIAAVGADGGNRYPVRLPGEKVFRPDAVVAQGSPLAQQVDVERIRAPAIQNRRQFAIAPPRNRTAATTLVSYS